MKETVKDILIYGGTTEGRRLAEDLCGAGFHCLVCVATGYGVQAMKEAPGLTLHKGRLDTDEMRELVRSGSFLAVVDATHPFATEATKNIKDSLKDSGIPYIRLRRKTEDVRTGQENIRLFTNGEACAEALRRQEGNILLTTGSKELAAFTEAGLKDRLFVRVLPSIESIGLCEKHGICGRQIIAMQGPFSVEMNKAMIRQLRISCLVTKESGRTGGYMEKLKAAAETGIKAFVIGNPEREDAGLSYRETFERLCGLAGKKAEGQSMQIALIGMGMGNEKTLTLEARERLCDAEYLFGAKRLLEGIKTDKEKYPYYQAEDILPKLKELAETKGNGLRAAVLFSGDTGFYSGMEKLYAELKRETDAHRLHAHTEIFAGISSMSYLSAKAKISWEDAAAVSIHGRNADVLDAVRHKKKVFLLASGAADMRSLGELFCAQGLTHLVITVGFQLSYPEEEIGRLTPEECIGLKEEGLYCCFIENSRPQRKRITHGLTDGGFLRDKVPMTKEEIREVCICKLGLTKDAVLYDIGSGTGSVAIECALLSADMKVYAVERKKEAAELIRKNCRRFGTSNITVIEAAAPEGLKELPDPTHVFIGGSGGKLREILSVLQNRNRRQRIVINAITLETIGEVLGLLKEYKVKNENMIQLQVSRSKEAGDYHLMQSENPVYVAAFDLGEDEEE